MRLIDANKLMEAIESLDWYHLNINGEMVHGANSDDHQAWYKSDDIYKAIRRAPTVDAPAWIPCSERMPEEETDVIVCNANGDIQISRGSYITEIKDYFIWYTTGWRFGKVIAWMPLPNPYKEDKNG